MRRCPIIHTNADKFTSCVREAAPKLASFAYVQKTPDRSHANLEKGGNDNGHRDIQQIALEEYYKNHPQFAPIHCLADENKPFKVSQNEVPNWDFILTHFEGLVLLSQTMNWSKLGVILVVLLMGNPLDIPVSIVIASFF